MTRIVKTDFEFDEAAFLAARMKVIGSEVPLEEQRKNAGALADLLENTNHENHNQNAWVTGVGPDQERNACGTVLCALGHAAFSDIIPDLGVLLIPKDTPDEAESLEARLNKRISETLDYGFVNWSQVIKSRQKEVLFYPTAYGLPVANWEYIGEHFFGVDVTEHVFLEMYLSKESVIERLRAFAEGDGRFLSDIEVEDEEVEDEEA